jgi:hypothetical protein
MNEPILARETPAIKSVINSGFKSFRTPFWELDNLARDAETWPGAGDAKGSGVETIGRGTAGPYTRAERWWPRFDGPVRNAGPYGFRRIPDFLAVTRH